MDEPYTSRTLATWAKLFREEGDVETADAIDAQLQTDEERSLSEEQRQRVERVVERARRCERAFAFEQAAEGYAQALDLLQAALGPSHPQVFECLLDLGRCRHNDGQNQAAMQDYLRLQRLVEARWGSGDPMAATARYFVRCCQDFIRQRNDTQRLALLVSGMVLHAQRARDMEAPERYERLRSVARRLAARGKHALALRFHDQAMALRLQFAAPDEELTLLDIQQHALELRDAGSAQRASAWLRQVIGLRNSLSAIGDQQAQLRSALSDLAACLAAQGLPRAAQETAALAEKLVDRPPADPADGPGPA